MGYGSIDANRRDYGGRSMPLGQDQRELVQEVEAEEEEHMSIPNCE